MGDNLADRGAQDGLVADMIAIDSRNLQGVVAASTNARPALARPRAGLCFPRVGALAKATSALKAALESSATTEPQAVVED